MITEEMYFRTLVFIHGYGTREGWARNDRQFRWDLHDLRGKVRGWITYEALWPLLNGAPAMRRAGQDYIVNRFGVPLPALEVPGSG
jgi:hypothetical protein